MKLVAFILSVSTCLFALPSTSIAANRTAVCRVEGVAVFPQRIHVACDFKDLLGRSLNKSNNHPKFFADTIQSSKSPSIMAIATAAWQSQAVSQTIRTFCVGGGKNGAGNLPANTEWFVGCNDFASTHIGDIVFDAASSAGFVTIVYNNDDLSGDKFGCLPDDCRMIVEFWSGGSIFSPGD